MLQDALNNARTCVSDGATIGSCIEQTSELQSSSRDCTLVALLTLSSRNARDSSRTGAQGLASLFFAYGSHERVLEEVTNTGGIEGRNACQPATTHAKKEARHFSGHIPTTWPHAAAVSVANPSFTPSVLSIKSPAVSMTKLSMSPEKRACHKQNQAGAGVIPDSEADMLGCPGEQEGAVENCAANRGIDGSSGF